MKAKRPSKLKRAATERAKARSQQRMVRPIRLTKMDIVWLQSVIQKPGAVQATHADICRRLLAKLNRMFWQLKLPKNHRAMIAKINKTVRQVRAFNANRPNAEPSDLPK